MCLPTETTYFSLSTFSLEPKSMAIIAILYMCPATVSGSFIDLSTHPVRLRCWMKECRLDKIFSITQKCITFKVPQSWKKANKPFVAFFELLAISIFYPSAKGGHSRTRAQYQALAKKRAASLFMEAAKPLIVIGSG